MRERTVYLYLQDPNPRLPVAMKTLLSTFLYIFLGIGAIAGAATLAAKSYDNAPMDADVTVQMKPGSTKMSFGEILCDGSLTNNISAQITEESGRFHVQYVVDNGREGDDPAGCSVSRMQIPGGSAVSLRRGETVERNLDGFIIRFQG